MTKKVGLISMGQFSKAAIEEDFEKARAGLQIEKSFSWTAWDLHE